MCAGGLRVLIADDQPLTRWAIAQVLTGQGGHTAEAGSRADACRALMGENFDVVIMASNLEGEDMTDVCSVLATREAVRLVVLADDESSHQLREALPRIRVVERPFDVSELVEAIRSEVA